jgi:epoxyqueuosine reductase
MQAQKEGALKLSPTDREWIEAQARSAGFDLCGVAAVPDGPSAEAEESSRRFAEWVVAGRAGEMEYLKRADDSGEFVRGGLRRVIDWARSVVVCAVNYNADAPHSIDPAADDAGWIARYAWSGQNAAADGDAPMQGSDYHNVLLSKLHVLEAEMRTQFPACETRCYVDTGPIVEREYAALAGVGWIGKNTCVLNQQQGSWLLLGVIVTSIELAEDAWTLPAADRCGSCTRCIDACPTEALLGNRQMDASRCIAYLTIEKKGSIDEELRARMGRQVFGCDICQDVCPWNRKAPVAEALLPPRRELVNPALEWLAAMDGATFNRWFRGSPLERTRRKRVLRNVAIAMGNSGDEKFLPRLEEWASGDDPVLVESARWAAERIHANHNGGK